MNNKSQIVRNLERVSSLFFLLLISCTVVSSQCPNVVIESANLLVPNGNTIEGAFLFDIEDQDSFDLSKVKVISKPSQTVFEGDSDIDEAIMDGSKNFEIVLRKALPPNDTEVEVIISNIRLKCGQNNSFQNVSSASKSGKIYRDKDVTELADKTRKDLENAVAQAKTSEEKNFFAGFSVASGQGGTTEGNGDISINQTFYRSDFGKSGLFDKAIVSLHIKKSTAENADLKQFTTGLTFRKTFLIGGKKTISDVNQKVDNLLKLQPSFELIQDVENSDTSIQTLKKKSFFTGLLVDQTFNLEGEAFDFDSVNFVSDTQLSLASIAKRLGTGTNGFYSLRLLGGGEFGRVLQKPEETTTKGATQAELDKVDWISRGKVGGIFTLRYLPFDNAGNKWGIQLDLKFVNRYLFSNEIVIKDSETEETTAKSIFGTPMETAEEKFVTITKGNRAYGQADLKIFPFGGNFGRVGFKLSYINGSLPPAFTPTKAFTFGFVIESSDDKSNDEPITP